MIGAVQCGYKRNDCAEKQTRLRLGLAGSLLTNSEQQPSGDKFPLPKWKDPFRDMWPSLSSHQNRF